MSVLFGNKIATVFNRHFDTITEVETWIPTVLNNVNISNTQGANITKAGLESADSCKLFVDSAATEKAYLSPIEWNKLTLEEKRNAYTFKDEDFFVQGDVSDVEILEENFLEWMVNHYDNVFRVTTVDIYADVLPHLEVGGK